MKATYDDVMAAARNGTLEQLDKATLEAYSSVLPRVSGNPGGGEPFAQAQVIIGRALDRLADKEREEKKRGGIGGRCFL